MTSSGPEPPPPANDWGGLEDAIFRDLVTPEEVEARRPTRADEYAAEEELSRFMLSAPEVEWVERLDALEAAGVPGEVIHLLWITITNTRDILDLLAKAHPFGTEGARSEEVEMMLQKFRREGS